MRKLLCALALLCVAGLSFAQDEEPRLLYSGGAYGQTFELYEYADGDEMYLELFMCDNPTKATPTAYVIGSKPFTGAGEYAAAVKASKDFFNYTMNYVDLAEFKDICDIAPCCVQEEYRIVTMDDGTKYIGS